MPLDEWYGVAIRSYWKSESFARKKRRMNYDAMMLYAAVAMIKRYIINHRRK